MAWTPRIDESFKDVCEADISMAEVEKAMKCLALDESLRSDGLSSNFCRHFWDHLKNLFFHVKRNISIPHSPNHYEARNNHSHP